MTAARKPAPLADQYGIKASIAACHSGVPRFPTIMWATNITASMAITQTPNGTAAITMARRNERKTPLPCLQNTQNANPAPTRLKPIESHQSSYLPNTPIQCKAGVLSVCPIFAVLQMRSNFRQKTVKVFFAVRMDLAIPIKNAGRPYNVGLSTSLVGFVLISYVSG